MLFKNCRMTRSKNVQQFGWSCQFFSCQFFFFFTFEEKKQYQSFFQKWTKKKWPLKKKNAIWIVVELHNFWCGDLKCTFFIIVWRKRKKSETPYYTYHMSHVTCHVSHVTYYMSPVTCHLSHVTCHVSHGMCLMSHVTCHFWHVTWDMWHVSCQMSHGTKF